MAEIRLREAEPGDAGMLSELALRSKAYWGYSEDLMAAFRIVLTMAPEDLAATRGVVAELSGRAVGFATVLPIPPDGELSNLWVEPAKIGSGVGRLLWEHAVRTAREAGMRDLYIEADPNAEGFYLAMGAERVGECPSGAVPGRVLPLLLFSLRP
jgi:N-acetylglutamate synthase-like GNAT family acetyltransferase